MTAHHRAPAWAGICHRGALGSRQFPRQNRVAGSSGRRAIPGPAARIALLLDHQAKWGIAPALGRCVKQSLHRVDGFRCGLGINVDAMSGNPTAVRIRYARVTGFELRCA